MTDLRDVRAEQRFEQGFVDADGEVRIVFADYAMRGDTRVILHVEADPKLRGSGAAGKFMQALAEQARTDGFKLWPSCSYAKAWLDRHPQYKDVNAA